MRFALFKNKTCRAALMMFLLCLMALPAHAASGRFDPAAGYAAQDYVLEAPYDVYYSGGLDVVYANVSTASEPTRAFVHEQINDSFNMDVQLYYYNGQRSVTLFSSSSGWPQVVKKIGDKIWFSYTAGSDPGYYSVPWDETLAIYPVASPTAEVLTDYNWEVEEDPDGRIFVCGATSMAGGQSIGYVDEANGNNVVMVINIGGNSSGFAVDSEGNIWSGEYILGWDPEMHIEPCRLGMWLKSDIDAAISSGTPLEWADAEVVINLGTTDITGETTNWGPNDIEADDQGNIYISMNTYDTWGYQHEWGTVKIYSPDGEGGYTVTSLGTTIQRTGIDEWDWARSLSFDGSGKLNDGGYTDPTQGGPTANILYLDMDLGATGNDVIDDLVAITVDADYDDDGVPDSVDNAPETANADQRDTDGDSYGNVADGDLNNDNVVGAADRSIFRQTYNKSSGDPGFNEDADFDGDGSVGAYDRARFRSRYNDTAPYF